MEIGAVILAGGQSRRMGRDKALLPWMESTFLERLCRELRGFPELLISVRREEDRRRMQGCAGLRLVEDRYPDCGPLGGLHAALCATRYDALLAISCDLPYFDRKAALWLCAQLRPEDRALAAEDAAGRLQPLCAVYRKTAAADLERQLQAGNFRLRTALEQLQPRAVSLAWGGFSDAVVTNVNTPEEYARLWESAAFDR